MIGSYPVHPADAIAASASSECGTNVPPSRLANVPHHATGNSTARLTAGRLPRPGLSLLDGRVRLGRIRKGLNMCTHVRWRKVLAVAALVCLVAPGAIARPTVQSTGPTRIKIAAGMVSAEDTRAGLLGVWEPDADLGPGLPAGSNHTIYLADGLYINPFRNVALIGFWSATADVLTSTPFDIRQLATGAPAPELKEVFKQITWDQPTVTGIAWLSPDRFQDKSRQEAVRRAQPVHDVTAVHRAAVVDLLSGSWIKPGGATIVFERDGMFREQAVKGTYDFDAVTGLLQLANSEVDAASLAARIFQLGKRAPSRLHWTSRDSVIVDGEQWTRQSRAPAPPVPPSTAQTPPAGQSPCSTCATGRRGFLGVNTPTSGAPIVSVVADSPAWSLGLRPGDLIVGLDGVAVQSGAAFRADLASRKPGDRVELTVSREGARSNLVATLAAGPNGASSLGVGLPNAGAVVVQVRAGSPAERAGLQVGDWIEAVNGRTIQDGDDLVRTIQAIAPGTDAVLTVVRDGTRFEPRVTIAELPQ